jgi:manganese oxidase
MMQVMGGTYWENVRKTFIPELISMNAMMAGMAPVMSFLMMGRDMRAMDPGELMFWFVMSLGVIAGFALAYPFNVRMVQHGLKHGLMTERPAGSHFALHKANSGHYRGRQVGGQHHRHAMKTDVTAPQLATVAGFTTFMLLIGCVGPAFFVNLTLGARDVGGIIMPRGMIMPFDTPAQTMRDMAAVRPRHVSFVAPKYARADEVLQPRIESGVKVYDIEALVIRWHILPDLSVDAYAYNRQIPGPRLVLTEGDRVRIDFRNNLPEFEPA